MASAANVIFFWSATGNTLRAAQRVAERLVEGGEDCEVVSIAAAGPGHRLDRAYRRVGLAFPVYWGGVPEPVERFIAGLAVGETPPDYVFTLVTSGGSGSRPVTTPPSCWPGAASRRTRRSP